MVERSFGDIPYNDLTGLLHRNRPEAHAANPELNGSTKRILLADDDEGVRDMGESVLPVYGNFEVDTAVDGEEAVTKFRQAHNSGRPYGAVMLDYNMPRKKGDEAAQEIRQIEENVPIVLTPAAHNQFGFPSDEELAKSGVDLVLDKPDIAKDLEGSAMLIEELCHAEHPHSNGSNKAA